MAGGQPARLEWRAVPHGGGGGAAAPGVAGVEGVLAAIKSVRKLDFSGAALWTIVSVTLFSYQSVTETPTHIVMDYLPEGNTSCDLSNQIR